MRNNATLATCTVLIVMGGCLGGTTSCTGGEEAGEPAMMAVMAEDLGAGAEAETYEGPCIPYGMESGDSAVLDPAFDWTPTPTPLETPVPLPTCTPGAGALPATNTPGPSPTPLATSVSVRGGGPAVRVSTSPRNVTLSPWSEELGRVAMGPRTQVVTWDESITLFTGGGAKGMQVADILGVSARAGVGVSPQGRIHVVGGGRYSYSDDGGVTWAAPSASPVGDDPFVVVGPDGYARALWQDGGGLRVSKQSTGGSWQAPMSLGGSGGDYDAVRTEDAVVVISAAGHVHRLPGGPAGSVGAADHVDLVYGDGELLAGLARGGDKAVIARSLDGGHSWSECLVQKTDATVHDVAVVPTTQGPYAVVWSRADSHFPSVMLSKVHWKPGEACGVWPEPNQVDQLEVPYVGAPRLFELACTQRNFRVDSDGKMIFMGFTCIDDGGESDVFVTTMSADGFFSGPALGGSRHGEEAP